MKRIITKRLIALAICAIMWVSLSAPALAGNLDFQMADNEISKAYAPGEVIVMFLSDEGEASDPLMILESEDEGEIIDAVAESLGTGFQVEDSMVFPEVEDDSQNFSLQADEYADNDLTVALVTSDIYSTEDMIERLETNEKVAAVQPDSYIYYSDYQDYELNDTYSSYLYQANSTAARNTAGDSVVARDPLADQQEPDSMISENTSLAWSKLKGDEEETVVAVVDTGINPNHEDLKNMLWTNPGNISLPGEHGYNFADDNADITDYKGHGTHCSGIIAAEANNGKGVAGITAGANVKIMALDINGGSEDESKLYIAMGAYNYVLKAKAAGVNVVATSNSWGLTDSQSTVFDAIINRMGEAGILTFIAAGNAATDLDYAVTNPASTESPYGITVGSGTMTGEAAGFSNYGQTQVDLFAPGYNILSTVGYECYFPSLYDTDKLVETTDYYGRFTPTTQITEDGSVIPETGDAKDQVNAFGKMVFCQQQDPYTEIDEPVQATCELSIDTEHFFTIGENSATLKVTIHNAQYGQNYFVYFPYAKNPETDGSHNTQYSIFYKSGDVPTAANSKISGGEVAVEEDGTCSLVNNGSMGHDLNGWNKYIDTHLIGSEASGKLLAAEEASGKKEVGIGLAIMPATDLFGWNERSSSELHDLVFYIDSIAVSRPDAVIDADSSYEMMSGTSMACPAAAGAGALLAALYPRTDGQSGAEYAMQIKNKLFSCIHKSEALKDKCFTGGFIDLSLLDDEAPEVSDAVCNVEDETITLYGSGLKKDIDISFLRLLQKDAEEVALPNDAMGIEFSDDGKSVVITHAKELFGTRTKFRAGGAEASFYLVKGQKELEFMAGKLFKNPEEENYASEDFPYIFTDDEGRNIYSIEYFEGTISCFDGERFTKIRGSNLANTISDKLLEEGYSKYDTVNNLSVSLNKTEKPLTAGNTLYVMCSTDFRPSGTADDDNAYTNYLASIDITAEQPEWTLREFNDPANSGWEGRIFYYEILDGKLYAMGSSEDQGKNNILLSYDLSSESSEWTLEAAMDEQIANMQLFQFNGKLYAMFGSTVATSPFDYANIDYVSEKVLRFDGNKLTQTGTLKYAGKFEDGTHLSANYPRVSAICATGLVFLNSFVDGAGNSFIYNPETDEITPLYYTINSADSDVTFNQSSSSVAARDGIYYMRDNNDEVDRGWGLWRLPASDGAYENYYPHEHTLVETAAKIATLSEDGNTAYWTCETCGRVFADSKAETEITEAETVIRHPETISLNNTSFKYTGSKKTPAVTVKDSSGKTIPAAGYAVEYKSNINAGTAQAVIIFKGNYSGTKVLEYKITKAANTMKLKSASKKYTRSKLKTKKTFKIVVNKAKGQVTYIPSAAAQKAGIIVTSSGKVTVPKKCKKGTYKITVNAQGNTNYSAAKKTFKIIIM